MTGCYLARLRTLLGILFQMVYPLLSKTPESKVTGVGITA
jgi:hypothetical protein